MDNQKKFNFSIILTACINPINMPFLEHNSVEKRLNDYKNAFIKWCNSKQFQKIIFIENSGYDLKYFHEEAKKFPQKKIEIISNNLNNSFEKKLGKGYGEYLCLKEVFTKSTIAKETDYFLKISGRYYVKNFNNIYDELSKNESDIQIYLKDNLTYAESNIFAGSKKFFLNYVIPFSSNTNDTEGVFIEHCIAKAALSAINDKLTFNHFKVYANLQGTIGTNNKEIKNNIFKRIKLYFFGKIKSSILKNKKY